MVMFRPLNLAKGSFPEVEMDSKGFDIIFCRNVLMYFSGHMAKHITQKFFHSLTDGGFLVTSQTELSMNVSNRFRRIRFKDGFFFQKTVAAQSATPAKPAAASPNRKKESPGPSQRRPSRKEKTVPRTRPMNSTVRTSLQEKDIPAGSIKQLYDKADYSGCIQLYHNRQTGNNFSIEERFYISKSFANLGEYQTATAIMEELITHKASEPDFYYFYAIILSEQGRWWEAEKNLVKALYLKPVFISARFSYFLVLKKMNQHQKAAKERQNLLNDMANYSDDDLIPGMEGVTAGSLRQMIDLM